MALSIINWLFSLICEPDRDRVEGASTFFFVARERKHWKKKKADVDSSPSAHPFHSSASSSETLSTYRIDQNLVADAENSPPGVVLAEGESFAAFLSQLFSLLSRGLGANPPSIPLMGFPSLPASFAREKRPRFVSRRAMEALVKAGPGPEPSAEEDCYICLRPVGTKNLSSEKASFSGGVGSGAKRTFQENEDENVESDQDAREKSCFPGPKGQRKRTGDDDDDSPLQQHEHHAQQQQRRQSQSSSSLVKQKPRAILRLPCGHRYCDCCLRRWLSSHSSCPTCRWSFPDRDCEIVAKEF